MAQVLIADDEEGLSFLLQRAMTTAGHEVRVALDGDQALAQLKDAPAEVAIVDMFMPGKDGIETILEIRRHHPATKIIAISGGSPMAGASVLAVAGKLGAHMTMSKPFTGDEILRAVQNVLDN